MESYLDGVGNAGDSLLADIGRARESVRSALQSMQGAPSNVVSLLDARRLRQMKTEAASVAQREGLKDARRMLFGYDDSTYGDYLLQGLAAFPYYSTRHLAQMSRYFATRPGQYLTLMKSSSGFHLMWIHRGCND